MSRLLALLLAACATTAGAQPQKIYRCGPDGRMLQQRPCGDAAPAAVAPAPGAAERAEAAAVAKREAKLAEQMQRERLQRERDEARSAAPAIGIKPPAPPASAPAKASKPRKKPATPPA